MPAAFAVAALAAVIAGCNSGTSNSQINPVPTATPTNPPVKGSASCTSGAAPATTTLPLAQGSNTLTSASVGGCSITVKLSGVTGTATQVTATVQLAAPSGLATPIAAGGQGGPPTGFSLPYTPIFYGSFTFNGTFGVTGQPAFTVSVPTITAGNNFFLVNWINIPSQPSSFQAYSSDCNGNALAMSISGNTLSLPGCATGGGGNPAPSGTTYVVAPVYF